MFLSGQKAKSIIALCLSSPLVFLGCFGILYMLGVGPVLSIAISIVPTLLFLIYCLSKREEIDKTSASFTPSLMGPVDAIVRTVRTQAEDVMEATVSCRITVDFPGECIVQEPSSLTVRFDLAPEDNREKGPRLGSDRPVSLSTHTSGATFSFDKASQDVSLSCGRSNKVEISFNVVPRKCGQHTIEIETFRDATRVGYREVLTKITDKNTRIQEESKAKGAVYENRTTNLKLVDSSSIQENRRIIHVTRNTDAPEILDYDVYVAGNVGVSVHASKKTGTEQEVLTSLQTYLNTLDEMVYSSGSDRSALGDWLVGLVGIGKDLFDLIVPDDIQSEIRSWKENSIVGISTEESWIPWELFHDGSNFVCRRFVLYRLPRSSHDSDDTRKNDLRNRPDDDGGESRLAIRKILNVIGGNLSDQSIKRLENMFEFAENRCGILNLRAKGISELVEMSQDTDLFHFTCHGKHPQGKLAYLQISREHADVLASNLLLSSVTELSVKNGSLVFLNTCRSESAQLLFREFASFGWKFYEKGAQLCIGTLMSIPQSGAIGFSEEFYRNLLVRKLPAYQALAETRERLIGEGQYFPLFYCVYGDPSLTLEFRTSATGSYYNEEVSDGPRHLRFKPRSEARNRDRIGGQKAR